MDSNSSAVSAGYYYAYYGDGGFGRVNDSTDGGYLGTGSYYGWGGAVIDITAPSGQVPSWHITSTGHNVSGNQSIDTTTRGYCNMTNATGIQFYFGAPYGNVRIYGVA